MTVRQIIHGPRFNLLVLSQSLAEQTILDKPYVMISITGSHQPQATLAQSDNLQDVLRLSFDDLARPTDGFTEPQKEDGMKVIDFTEKWKDKVKTIVVHCEAGRSRSAGIAAAISKVYNGDDMVFYKYYNPNSLAARVVKDAACDKGLV